MFANRDPEPVTITWAIGCLSRRPVTDPEFSWELLVGGAFLGIPGRPAGELAVGGVVGVVLDVGPVELAVGVVPDEVAEEVFAGADCSRPLAGVDRSSSTCPARGWKQP